MELRDGHHLPKPRSLLFFFLRPIPFPLSLLPLAPSFCRHYRRRSIPAPRRLGFVQSPNLWNWDRSQTNASLSQTDASDLRSFPLPNPPFSCSYLRRGNMASVYQKGDANVLSPKILDHTKDGVRAVWRGRRLGRISMHRFLLGLLILAAAFSILMVVFGLDMIFHGRV